MYAILISIIDGEIGDVIPVILCTISGIRFVQLSKLYLGLTILELLGGSLLVIGIFLHNFTDCITRKYR